MADTKISALTALAAADVDTAADVLAIVDTSATTTKKIPVDDLRTAMGPKLATEQATTSGTEIDFTSIPSWVKKITVMFNGVSTNGTSPVTIQLGDAGGVEATNYLGAVASTGAASITTANISVGFNGEVAGAATVVRHGAVTLTLEDASDFTWVAQGVVSRSDATALNIIGGTKALSAALDRVRITTVGGSDVFDAGAVNLMYE
jgi:hypothetical protein